VARWQAAEGNEQREAQKFWIELLGEVLAVARPTHLLDFERKVQGRRIDVFFEDMRVLIEHKSRGTDLNRAFERGKDEGGAARLVTPFEQAKWYADNLPRSQSPRWLIVCNFDEIRIHDLNDEHPAASHETLHLTELPDQLHRLSFLTRKENSRLERERKLSIEAGTIVGKLYDALSARYHNIEADRAEQRSLNILITRIVFLLYAEDAGLLQAHQAFYHYLKDYNADAIAAALRDLFTVLRTPEDARSALYVPDKAKAFPYINGGLFADNTILIPPFDECARALLLQEASAGFDWKDISPTIFGAVFESTLNPETRRAGGMHYTSIENIHKVIDPLFLDALRAELARIEGEKQQKKREFLLHAYRRKLAALTIFDPACGSGNFLTETYIGLRKLENRVLENLHAAGDGGLQTAFGGDGFDPIQVQVRQFYGIEINDFAVEVAKTALWIAELQMLEQTREILHTWLDPLPLKNNANIHCANALRLDWNTVLPAGQCSYIIGNPPFLGSSVRTKAQTEDMEVAFGDEKKWGKCDYCVGWYRKASTYMTDSCRAALVSTNSITQGEQVEPTWQRFFAAGFHIDFAYKTFVWDSEATDKAHVHCVIIGFSRNANNRERTIISASGEHLSVSNINGYLIDAPSIFLQTRGKNINAQAPQLKQGNKPVDGGNLILSPEEADMLGKQYPELKQYIKPYIDAQDFLNATKPRRYCLWFVGIKDRSVLDIPEVKDRLNNIKEQRLLSPTKEFQGAASEPEMFVQIR
ncbi:MAG: class I SAM-dependent DNA methyltransferase, partial [Rhodocyclaceae bacterium]|nr:class I SAM-dependent DNA methyltransferase [Rhodocyclaceae bacterium]